MHYNYQITTNAHQKVPHRAVQIGKAAPRITAPNQHIPSIFRTVPYGLDNIRYGLKIRRPFRVCRFDSGREHHKRTWKSCLFLRALGHYHSNRQICDAHHTLVAQLPNNYQGKNLDYRFFDSVWNFAEPCSLDFPECAKWKMPLCYPPLKWRHSLC